MLPGFRFLFATVVLAISVLIFGLGAAALLRAAHEEFASLPSWRPAQPSYPALRTDFPPTLALLRVDTPEAKPAENPMRNTRETVGSSEGIPAASQPPEKVANPDASRNALAKATDAEVNSQPGTADVKSFESKTIEMTAVESKTPDAKASDVKAPDASLAPARTFATTTPPTTTPVTNPPATISSGAPPSEAGLPDARTPEMASADATAEATVVTTQPAKPVVTKARGLSARAIARRRMLARARAAARARSMQQPQRPNPDPFAQLFYGGARS